MPASYQARLARNIPKYFVFRVLSKRAYYPLIAVYAVSVAGLSLYEIGLVASITAAVSLILEVPSGYLSDRIGHKRSIVFGTVVSALSSLGYILWPNFWGVLLGSAGFFGGFAFLSGTMEAFMHETLLELGRDGEYPRIAAKSQSFSLFVNALILALVPLTYPIDPRLPFLIGFAMLALMSVICATFTTPIRTKRPVRELETIGFLSLLRNIHGSGNHLLFILLGIVTATFTKVPEFREIYYQDLGIPVIYFGFAVALASLAGSAVSFHIHKLNAIFTARRFYLFDLSLAFLGTAAIGLTRNPFLGILFFVLHSAYSRSRDAVTDAYVLKDCPTRELKATYLSVLAFFEALNGIWIPLLLGYLIGSLGPNQGYVAFGAGMFALGLVLYLRIFRRPVGS